MDLRRISRLVVLLCWVLCNFCRRSECESSSSGVSVRFLQVPPAFSNQTSATFVFEVTEVGSSERNCSNCNFTCKLDESITLNCEDRNASLSSLQDGQHTFMVCTDTSSAGCFSYTWTIDTVAPTAYITASTSFTSAMNVSVNISFSEPCGFGCLAMNNCNLIAYGDGQVMPQTLDALTPNLKYSMTIALSSSIQYGRVVLVMDKGFCSDAAGNRFIRTENSSFIIHFDRRKVLVNLRTHVPERLVQLDGQKRTVQATNNSTRLKVYLYFSQPVLNTTDEILRSVNVSHGSLQPIEGKSLANRRFGYLINDVPHVSIITVNLNSDMIISRQGTQVSPAAPATLLYDTERPAVMLSTSKMITKEKTIVVSARFTKPVFSFDSTHLSISGGHLQSFHQVSRSYYAVYIQAADDAIYVSVPDNVTSDVAGNENLPSNVLVVRHYSAPVASIVLGNFVTASFLATCLLAGMLTVSTANLQSAGALARSLPSLTSDPTRNLFRIACYIQVFAFSRWLAATLPTEYYELTTCLKWSVPYLNLPWENDHMHLPIFGPTLPSSELFSKPKDETSAIQITESRRQGTSKTSVVYGAPLTATEYRSFFENQSFAPPQAEYVPDQRYSDGWMDFKRSMFWLAVISGSLILLHVLLLLILMLRSNSSGKQSYGALVFPRFEIFLLILSVPCICKASVSVIKGGTRLGNIVGILLLLFTSCLQLALFAFLSFGITLGRLLQYKEVHQVDRKFHWYQELVRVTLGPGKRGQWTWMDQSSSADLTKLGPLFEDLRGPPKYMLSQFSTSSGLNRADRIIASDDETEDAEAPFIQKLFGILRIYYTLLESLKRFSLGVASGLVFFSGTVHPSKAPTVALLSITAFQLFFLVLKKPFIKKKVQLAEIISITCELGMFATLMGLLQRDFWTQDEHKIGVFMIVVFITGYLALLINEWYALWKQIKNLDREEGAFGAGLRRASAGLLFFCFPEKLIRKLDKKLLINRENGEAQENGNRVPPMSSSSRSSESVSRSSSGVDKAWERQVRKLAGAGFAKEPRGSGNDGRRSQLWSKNKSRSPSSMTPSTECKRSSKSKGLHKDLEAIFAASTSDQTGEAGSGKS